jgi:hypothetical protein
VKQVPLSQPLPPSSGSRLRPGGGSWAASTAFGQLAVEPGQPNRVAAKYRAALVEQLLERDGFGEQFRLVAAHPPERVGTLQRARHCEYPVTIAAVRPGRCRKVADSAGSFTGWPQDHHESRRLVWLAFLMAGE